MSRAVELHFANDAGGRSVADVRILRRIQSAPKAKNPSSNHAGRSEPSFRSRRRAGQRLGIREVDDGVWLASFMQYDLGYIDLEQKTLQPIDNPFGPGLSPMS